MSLKLADRIKAFSQLGLIIKEACSEQPSDKMAKNLKRLAECQYLNNSWFTPYYVNKSLSAIADSLREDLLPDWLKPYPILSSVKEPKKIVVIMAGNIPLVGFHDFLSVLISGNIIIAKTSSKDRELISEIQAILLKIEPLFKDYIILTDDKINNHDAVIATGSNNSSRYFEYHYGSKPHIFRKNRNSVAIVSQDISDKELVELGKDVFYYFGLGCRNVSKLYLPPGFDIMRLKKTWSEFARFMDITPYRNNYNYNKALFKVDKTEFKDLGFVLLKEDTGLSSPISTLYYSYYRNIEDLKAELLFNSDKIQAIVGKGHIPFGQAQYPALNDYADGIDTIEFISNL